MKRYSPSCARTCPISPFALRPGAPQRRAENHMYSVSFSYNFIESEWKILGERFAETANSLGIYPLLFSRESRKRGRPDDRRRGDSLLPRAAPLITRLIKRTTRKTDALRDALSTSCAPRSNCKWRPFARKLRDAWCHLATPFPLFYLLRATSYQNLPCVNS